MLQRAIDAAGNDVQTDFIVPDRWDELRLGTRKLKVSNAVFCPGCNGLVHWRRTPTKGIPYFHHNPGSTCDLARPESEEHLGTVHYLASIVNHLMPNWTARMEETAKTAEGDDVRVDVAVHYAGTGRPKTAVPAKWAYEVQRSQQTGEMVARRSGQRRSAGYEGIQWVLPERTPWLGTSRDTPGIVDAGGYVTDGFAQPDDWPVPTPSTLVDAVRRCHSGRTIFTEFGLVPDGFGGFRSLFAWVPTDWVSTRPKPRPTSAPTVIGAPDQTAHDGYCRKNGVVVGAVSLRPMRNTAETPSPCIICGKPTLRLTPSGNRHSTCEPAHADPWGIGAGRHRGKL